MPDRQLTLQTLLALKQRRERRIRAAIAQLTQQQQQLDQMKAQLIKQRKNLWHQWHQCCNGEQVMTPVEWRKFRARLAEYYQQDQSLLEQIEATNCQHLDLQAEKDQQQQVLRHLQVEQEKLKILME